MDAKEVSAPVAGGSFLIRETKPGDVFAPEAFTDEHRLIAQTARDFAEREIIPNLDRIEQKDWALTRQLFRRLGELGFLGAGVPTAYGGSELDMITSLIVAEELAVGSFSVSFGAHVGIGMEPIVFFGTEAQRRRYLPPMVRGELIGAYALTEPTAGSDAMAIRTKAARSPDGRFFLLSGAKQFISNASFADLFNVFAKVDGDQHTCFLVDRTTPGVSVGEEEHKMGVRGSSTASVFLENAPVPAENVLGEVGQGFKVAVNILNMGRFRLAAGCVGASKQLLRQVIAYAHERRQFGRALAEFGLIKHKLAEMAVRVYVAESMAYRTGVLDEERRLVSMTKKVVLFTAGVAVQKFLDALEEQQEILAGIADLVIETFAMESALLRALRAVEHDGREQAAMKTAMVESYVNDAVPRIDALARTVLAAVAEGDGLRTQLAGLRRFLRYTPKNTIALRRTIADRLIQQGRYTS